MHAEQQAGLSVRRPGYRTVHAHTMYRICIGTRSHISGAGRPRSSTPRRAALMFTGPIAIMRRMRPVAAQNAVAGSNSPMAPASSAIPVTSTSKSGRGSAGRHHRNEILLHGCEMRHRGESEHRGECHARAHQPRIKLRHACVAQGKANRQPVAENTPSKRARADSAITSGPPVADRAVDSLHGLCSPALSLSAFAQAHGACRWRRESTRTLRRNSHELNETLTPGLSCFL